MIQKSSSKKQKTYKVTVCDGSTKHKNRLFVFKKDAIYDDKKRIIEYSNIHKLVLGKRVGFTNKKYDDHDFGFSLVHEDGTGFDFEIPKAKHRLALLLKIMSKLPDNRKNAKQKERLKNHEYRKQNLDFILDHQQRQTLEASSEDSSIATAETESMTSRPRRLIERIRAITESHEAPYNGVPKIKKSGQTMDPLHSKCSE